MCWYVSSQPWHFHIDRPAPIDTGPGHEEIHAICLVDRLIAALAGRRVLLASMVRLLGLKLYAFGSILDPWHVLIDGIPRMVAGDRNGHRPSVPALHPRIGGDLDRGAIGRLHVRTRLDQGLGIHFPQGDGDRRGIVHHWKAILKETKEWEWPGKEQAHHYHYRTSVVADLGRSTYNTIYYTVIDITYHNI